MSHPRNLTHRAADRLARSAHHRPGRWLLAALLLSALAATQLPRLSLDADLVRLLPEHARASRLTRELEPTVRPGGYFTFLLEGDDPAALDRAAERVAERIRQLPGVEEVEDRWPLEFLERYRYLLLDAEYLELVLDELIRWEASASPLVDELEADPAEESFARREDRADLDVLLRRYLHLPERHRSPDGRVAGMLVRTREDIGRLGSIRGLYGELGRIARETAAETGLWTGVGGSHRNKLDELDLIRSDLRWAGLISGGAILLVLLGAFRSFGPLPVVLLPLAAGLLWGFALVPSVVGSLNLITSFLVVILFGMGVDFSLHLVKRMELELGRGASPEGALAETLASTGTAVLVSGATTALALAVLPVSDFRGFAEFGVVGALSLATVLAAMVLVLPPMLALGVRWGWVRPRALRSSRSAWVPGRGLTVLLAVFTLAAGLAAVRSLRFDEDFRRLQYPKSRTPGARAVKERERRLYSGSRSPGALLTAPDLEGLDDLLDLVRSRKADPDSRLGRVRSIRTFAPGPAEETRRRVLLAEIREVLRGGWTRRVEDPDRRRLIDDFLAWAEPAAAPLPGEVPTALARSLTGRDDSLLVAIHPRGDRKDGRVARVFTGELYELPLPPGARGPVGETAVFAEILWLVRSEGPWLVGATLLGVFLLVWLGARSLRDALWTVLPLVVGLVWTLGAAAALGWPLDFFNVVALPALLGMGVDDGVHYVRRRRELRGDVPAVQGELRGPLTVTTVTTLLGYAGLLLAGHPGIRSLGRLACLGLALTWAATLGLLPGLMGWRRR